MADPIEEKDLCIHCVANGDRKLTKIQFDEIVKALKLTNFSREDQEKGVNKVIRKIAVKEHVPKKWSERDD